LKLLRLEKGSNKVSLFGLEFAESASLVEVV